MRTLLSTTLLLSLSWGGLWHDPAHAAPPPAVDTPLTASEIHAIEQEAIERRNSLGDNHEAPAGPPWKTLTPDKLAQLLRMPQFQKLGYDSHGVLLDQAMAWDLVHFQNLSDIKRFFQQVNGKDYFQEPPSSARSAEVSHIGYYTDTTASAEAGALSALFNCMPWANWAVESDDPLLWTMQRGDNWDVPNTFDFGLCVRKQREDQSFAWPNDPDTARGARSAAIIEERLSRQLLAHGCSGTGPDHCLGLLRALFSLGPAPRDGVAIIKRLDADTAATQPESIPAALQGYRGSRDDPLTPLYQQTRHQLLRKGIVLSAKLDLMLRDPQSWTPGEIDTGVDAAIALMLAWRRLDWMVNPYGMHNARWYGFENPWQHLGVNGQTPPAIAARLRQLGTEAAADKGCASAKLAGNDQPPDYWYAYAVAKLQREGNDCQTLPLDWIAGQYVQASQQNRRALLAPIAEVAAWVDEKATADPRDRIRDSIGRACPAKDWGADYWGLCARQAAIVLAERKREEAQREAEEAAARALQNDPCRNGSLVALLQQFGYGDDKGYAIGNVQYACKPLPDAAGTAAIAVFHQTTAPTVSDENDSDGDYELHLMVVDKDGTLLAQTRVSDAAESDAVSLDEVGIDTGLYRLAPDVRAFGVTTYNAAHCYQCAFSETKLSLFVREGKTLHKVLDGLMQDTMTPDGEETANCYPSSETTSTLAIGPQRHAGYADLIITATTVHSVYVEPESKQTCAAAAPDERSRTTWIYDGKQYRPAKP
ncbi:MAG TPA: hypothetical protein VN046_07950 [Stenotrophobium sp.]|nr:hypothetical protein [Stenotrophobium sp.]